MVVAELDRELEEDIDEVEGELELIKFRLIGRTQLLMKSNAGVNPLNPLVKERATYTAIKKRTDEHTWEIYRLDFILSMYHDLEIGPYIPGVNIEAGLVEAGKTERMGEKVKTGVTIVEDKIPLQYKGPRDIEKLWKAETFVDIRAGKLRKTSSVMICRPSFNNWSLTATASYNGAILDRAAVERFIRKIGDIGIRDYRKRYGKSRVEIL